MGAAVVTATADGFAQSYAGLYAWALEHGLHGWKAASFPLMVDLLIVVGELGLFLLAIDAYSLQRKHFLTWFDFILPLLIAVAGWTASLIFNVGHVKEHDFSYQATAAVPPIVSMLGLLVLLRTLHRYVSDRPTGSRPEHHPRMSAEAQAMLGWADPGPVPAASGAALATAAVPSSASERTGIGRDGAPADDAWTGGGVRLVRLTQWPPGNGQAVDEDNPPDSDGRAQAGGPAAQPEPRPRPATDVGPHLYRPAGGTQGGGAGAVQEPARGARPEAEVGGGGNGRGNGSTLTLSRAAKERLLEELHEHQGNVQAALETIEADGLTCEEGEAHRIRRNNWLPYVVYRLLAQHGGDVDRVSQALAEKHIDCEPTVLDELARSWQ